VENEERVTRREKEREREREKGVLHKGELSWGMEEDEEGHAMLITHLHHHHFSHTFSPSFTLQPHHNTHPTLSQQHPRSSTFS